MNEKKWIKKQAEVYSTRGFDEPDRLIKNLGIKTEKRFEALIRIIDQFEGGRVIEMLDAGCASGAISRYITKRYDKVKTDLADLPTVIDKIEEFTENKYPLDFNKEFPNKKYDIIYATEMIEHLYNDWFFIKNCYNHLNDEGYLIITAPMECGNFTNPENLHIRAYPGKMLEELLQVAGFTIEESWVEGKGKRVVARK